MALEVVYTERPLSHSVHTHISYELLYVQEGAIRARIQGKEYDAPAGSLLFLNQFEEHATQVLTLVYRRYYLLIPPTQLQAFRYDVELISAFRFHGERFPYVLPTGEKKPRFDTYFALMREAWAEGGDDRDRKIEALLTCVLVDGRRLMPEMFRPPAAGGLLPIQEVLDRLDREWDAPFSLEALAAQYHVSPGCLSSHFRKQVGVSPMQYAMLTRLAHARLLLLTTDLSVGEIARRCGWQDGSNFDRRFRRQFGVSPLQLRRRGRTDK